MMGVSRYETEVQLTFTQPLLGTAPLDPDIYEEFIATRRPDGIDEAEVESLPVEEEIKRGSTGFHRDPAGRPCLYDYHIKGFFKDAAGMLRRAGDTQSAGLSAHKKIVDGLVFVAPRQIALELPDGGRLDWLSRPLRAQTAQGERIALTRSEMAPVGTRIRFTVSCLGPLACKKPEIEWPDLLAEWFEYGHLRGLGQWRNGGYGSFEARWRPTSGGPPVGETRG